MSEPKKYEPKATYSVGDKVIVKRSSGEPVEAVILATPIRLIKTDGQGQQVMTNKDLDPSFIGRKSTDGFVVTKLYEVKRLDRVKKIITHMRISTVYGGERRGDWPRLRRIFRSGDAKQNPAIPLRPCLPPSTPTPPQLLGPQGQSPCRAISN